MKRLGFNMSINEGQLEEYTKRHSPIWPELEQALKAHGAHNYSIFHSPQTNQLFGYVEIEDLEIWNKIASTDICKKWWKYMSEIMPSNPDHSPISKVLTEVFHLK
jgi:L-rhamnose mutarotase